MAITGLPDYSLPVEQSIRCVCGLRYVVFTGGRDFDQAAGEAARDRASQMNAQFVDARIAPFMQCRCGALLDFTIIDSCELVMYSDVSRSADNAIIIYRKLWVNSCGS